MSEASFSASDIQYGINGGRRCAACKYLRRRCLDDCILAPYFHHSQPERFVCVHKIFGASNVARMLQHLPVHDRARAADAIASEAYMRAQDPIYGCTAVIARLQREIHEAQNELAMIKAQVTIHRAYQYEQNRNLAQPNYDVMGFQEKAHWAPEGKDLLQPDLFRMPPDFL